MCGGPGNDLRARMRLVIHLVILVGGFFGQNFHPIHVASNVLLDLTLMQRCNVAWLS